MKPIRVALLCDYLEERWPSMDLTAEMIQLHLERHHAGDVAVTRICPSFQHRFSRIPKVGFNLDRLINRYWEYPRGLSRIRRKQEFDVYHLVDHSYGQLIHRLPAERTVVTCHDLDTFRCLLEPGLERRPAWFRALTRHTLAGFQKGAVFACNSEATRQEILRHGLVRPERVRTVTLGISPEFTPGLDPIGDAMAVRLLGPREDPGAVEILHVGSCIPRKRIDVLLRVFAGIRAVYPQARLIRVGSGFRPDQERLADSLGIRGAITQVSQVDRVSLAAIYRRADVVLQPSESEGFGLPVVEALGCGVPVVASDLPVLREVSENLALYCPVGEVSTWVATALGVLGHSGGRSWWVDRTRVLRQEYDWSRHVSDLVVIYRQLVG
jgi:glycosyltransferase involved in cell wall biosynthesis